MNQLKATSVYPWQDDTHWMQLPEGVSDKGSAAIEKTLRERVLSRIECGEYSADNVAYVEKMSLSLVDRQLQITDKRLEKLRTLCQLWDIDLREKEISSHRRFIGPIIVFAKRALFRVLRVLMKDVLRQQRVFNATAISLLTDLSNEHHAASEEASNKIS